MTSLKYPRRQTIGSCRQSVYLVAAKRAFNHLFNCFGLKFLGIFHCLNIRLQQSLVMLINLNPKGMILILQSNLTLIQVNR